MEQMALKKKKALHTMYFNLPQTKINQSVILCLRRSKPGGGGRVRAEQMVDGRLSAEGQGARITDAVSDLALLPCSLKPG